MGNQLGLAIPCGHTAKDMTISAIYGSGSNVDLKRDTKVFSRHRCTGTPGKGAAVQAAKDELASAGHKLAQNVLSSLQQYLPYQH